MATTKSPNGKLIPKPDPIADAEAVIRDLENQRLALIERRSEQEAERQRIAFDARVHHDKEASARLSEMSAEAIRSEHEARDIEAALQTAQARLQQAKAAEAAKVVAARVKELRELVGDMAPIFGYVDEHLKAAADGLNAIDRGFDALRRLGVNHPGEVQIRLSIVQCLNSWAMKVPESWYSMLSEGLRYLPPDKRQDFSTYWKRIELSLENGIRRAAGERPLSELPRPLTAEEKLDDARRNAPPSPYLSGGAKPPKPAPMSDHESLGPRGGA
jgi:hypothetical protein